jgi:glycosyltransferase involved in cell wall biosynthesis
LVDPTDIDSIADALVEVLDNPDRAEQLRIAGRARAATFTWSAAADAALAAYAEAQT